MGDIINSLNAKGKVHKKSENNDNQNKLKLLEAKILKYEDKTKLKIIESAVVNVAAQLLTTKNYF